MLEVLFGFNAFGKHHKPRGVAVKAMYYEEFVAWVLPFQVVAQYGVGGSFLYLVITH